MEFKEKRKNWKFPSISYEIAHAIQDMAGEEVRITVPGHTQRGGEPCPYDRVLSTRLGAAAAGMIMRKEFGNMAGIRNNKIVSVPLQEVAGKLKTVNPDDPIIMEAKSIGICFGDDPIAR